MQNILDSTQFRKVMGQFVTGVTIVTSREDENIHGMTCNAVFSISISPPSVLVSLAKKTRTEMLIEQGRVFAVNVLSESQQEFSDRFAGHHKDQEGNRFQEFPWTQAVTGAPISQGSQAYLDCKLVKAVDAGTHTLFVGEVLAAHWEESLRPLIFYRSQYIGLDSLKRL